MGRVKEAAYAWPPASQAISSIPIYEKTIGQGLVSKQQPVSSNVLNEIATIQNAPTIYPLGNSSVNSSFFVAAAAPNQMVVSPAAAGMQTQSTTSIMSQQVAPMISQIEFATQSSSPVFPKVPPSQSPSLLSPLSQGGFIFNYPPLYSDVPMPPFSRPVTVSNDVRMQPSSPISSSSLSESVMLSPGSPLSPIASNPTSPQFSNGISVSSSELRKEKLEKYRQKRTKRNFNRPVDQARRERAQARPRDEHGHFLTSRRNDPEKERMKVEMIDVRTQLETWRKESQLLKDRLSAMEHQLQEQQQLNNDLLHENRILWSTLPADDVFNTLRPGTSYVDAFKEKVDLSNVELNFTDSPFLEGVKLDDLVDFTGSLS